MNNQMTNTNNQKEYNLSERTAKFGEEIIKFAKNIKPSMVNNPIINQLVRSGTSVGANYCEANEAGSKKDFQYKISLVKKEAKETMYWLRMIGEAESSNKDTARKLWQESHEFVLIFSTILKPKK